MTNRMNKIRLFSRLAFAVVVVILLNACGKDSRLIQKEISFTDTIKGIIVDGPWEVVVEFDTVHSGVLLECNEPDQDRISAKLLPNGYLHLKISSLKGNLNKKVFRAKVSASWFEKIELSGAASLSTYGYYDSYSIYPFEIIDISLSGASRLSLNNFVPRGVMANVTLDGASDLYGFALTGYMINVKLSGASHLDLWYYGYNMEAEISGASSMSLRYNSAITNYGSVDCSGASIFSYYGEEGYAGGCSFKGSGASRFLTEDLEMENLDIHLSGASEAKVNVKQSITGNLTGSSTLEYKGNADVSGVSASGASKIKKLD